ncbi:hypothetical protein S83_055096, partial [Arachis hypogaea]
KLEFELETRNQVKAEDTSGVDLESSLSTQEKDIEAKSTTSGLARKEEKKYNNKMLLEINLINKGSLNHRIMNNIKIYCLLIRGELNLDLMENQKSLSLTGLTKNNKLIEKAMFTVELIRLSREKDEQLYIYQTIVLSLLHKCKRQIKKIYSEKTNVDKTNFAKSIPRIRDKKITENKEKIIMICLFLNSFFVLDV